MNLEQAVTQWLETTPKWLVALLVISIGVAGVMLVNPMKTVCHTDRESLMVSMEGLLTDRVDEKKRKVPATFLIAKQRCSEGNSAGACYDYLRYLKEITRRVNVSSTECFSVLFEEERIQKTIAGGMEMMALMAWGDEPPADAAERYNWLSSSDVATFCQMRRIFLYAAADDGEAWNAFRERIFAKYPGKRTADDLTEWTVTDEGEVPGPKAKDELSKVEIWNRSLLSAPCDTLI